MTRGRKRTPTGEELQLWEKVTDTVAPLAPRPPKVVAPRKPSASASKEKPRKTAPPVSPPVALKPPPKPSPPALNPIDRRTRLRLGRGTVAIDRRIDLHGMTQAAAEGRLRRFLAEAQSEGAKVVLVITGKGRSGAGDERGVLRRVVPIWLSSPALRPVVVGFDEAGPMHGGSGALYVRIRRLRE